MIVAIHYKKSFDIFSREQCDTKIDEVLNRLNLVCCKKTCAGDAVVFQPDWTSVSSLMKTQSSESRSFLENSLELL